MLKHRKSKTFYRHYFTTFIYVISIGECDYVDVNNIRLDDDSSDITVVTNTARDVGGWSCRVRTPADASISSLLEENDNGDLGFWFEHMDVAEKNRLTGMRGEGLTLLFVKNRNRDDWLNSPPKITVPVRGAKVYDPRLGAYVGPYQTPTTVFSRNPALQYADYLRSVEYGAGKRNIPITNSNIIELANHFDQIPDSIGNDGINSILIDVQIDTGKPIVDNMNVWMQGTRLYTSDYYGEFNVRVETKSSSVWTFNEDDLEGETQYESGDFTERLNSLTYTIKQLVQDESEGSQVGGGFGSQTDGGFDDNFYLQLGDLVEVDVETTFPEYGTAIHTAWLAEDGGIANFSSSSLDYVSEVDQALYWTMVDARISRQPRTLEIPVGAIGWLFETGDVIQHTSEIMEETNAYWRVSEVSENGGETVLNCIAYDDTFYVPDPNVVPTPIAFANPPITLTIPAVTGFELNVVNGEFYLQWDELNDSRVLWYAVEIYVGELLVQTNQRVSQSPLLITSPIVESYTANIVPYGINLEGEATLLEFDIYIPVTSTDDPTVTSKEGFITVAPPELESNKFTYEWQWYTSVDATVISGGTTIAKTISNVTPDVTYLIEYRIVTPNGKGDWESVSVNGIEKTTYIWYVYADNETGVGISLDPTGKTFFGIVGGKSVPTVDITDPTIFDYYQQPSGDATVGDGISAQLTKENYVVYTDGDGNNGDFSGASAKLNILVGSLNDTNSWTITTSESAGITGSLTGTTYTVGSLSASQGLITFTATREDYPTFVRSFNIVKVQDGNSPSAIIPTITDNLDGTYTIDDGTVGGESIIVNNPIKGRDYFDGNDGSFVSFIYRNSVNQPTPAPEGGEFNGFIETYPDPTLNSDTPNYEDGKIVWVSTTRYSATSTGTGDDRVTTWSNSGWSAYSEYIIKGEVGDSIEVQYSPDTTAANFSAGFATNDLYMRQRVGTGGWSAPILIVGEKGDGGDYTDYQFTLSAIQPTDDPDNPVDSTWTDSPSEATDTSFIWMIIGTKNHLGVIQGAGWSTPRRISGSKGETGVGKTLTLSATGSAFKYDKNGDLISDATITVTAATQGISTSLLWSNGGGGTVYTVSAASLGNNNSITVWCRSNDDDSVIDYFTIYKLVDGSDGSSPFQVILSNETHQIPTDKDGNNGVFTGSGTTVRLFEGTRALGYRVQFGAGQWKISTEDIGVSTTTLGSGIEVNDVVVPVNDISSLSGDTGHRIFTITGLALDGVTSISLTAQQSFSKSKQGLPSTEAGPRGSSQFYITGTSWTNSLALQAITNGGFDLKVYDRVTISSSVGPFSETKFWDGSFWRPVNTVIDGNLIVNGIGIFDEIGTNSVNVGSYVKINTDAYNEAFASSGVIKLYAQSNNTSNFAGVFSNPNGNALGVDGLLNVKKASGTALNVDGDVAITAGHTLTIGGVDISSGNVTKTQIDALNIDAATLDGATKSSFMLASGSYNYGKLSANQSWTGTNIFTSTGYLAVGKTGETHKALMGVSTVDGEFLFGGSTTGGTAGMTNYLRLGAGNKLQYTSGGTTKTVYHSGNIPSYLLQSTAGQLYVPLTNVSDSTGVGTVVKRDDNGDIHTRYLQSAYVNMSHNASGATTNTVFYSSSDDYIRKNTATGFRTSLSVYSKTEADLRYATYSGIGTTFLPKTHDMSLTINGDATGTVTFTDMGSATLYLTVADDSHSHSQLFIPDTRGAIRPPSYYPDKHVSYDFQENTDTLAGDDPWHVLQTVAKWSGYFDTIPQQQIAYTGPQLKHRAATSDSAWGTWKTIWDSNNFGKTQIDALNIDADKLDGKHASEFLLDQVANYRYLRSDGSGTLTGTLNTTVGLGRLSHHTGHLIGSYNSVAVNSSKSNPIYTIGSAYNPNADDLNNMYGIGYSYGTASFLNSTDLGSNPAGWGMYVAADGNARIFLNASNGHGYFKGQLNAQNLVIRGDATVSGNDVYHSGNIPSYLLQSTAGQLYLAKTGGTLTGSILADDPASTTDWNANWRTGFYESNGGANAPSAGWFWGLKSGHSANTASNRYGMDLVIQNGSLSTPYIRSTGNTGAGTWQKIHTSTNFGKTEIDALNIDADKLDGKDSSEFELRQQAAFTYVPLSNATADSVAGTVVKRNGSRDINVRLLRSTFGTSSSISGAIAYRINDSTDNYVRYCSSKPAIRTFLETYSKAESDARYATYSGIGSTFIASRVTVNASSANALYNIVFDDGNSRLYRSSTNKVKYNPVSGELYASSFKMSGGAGFYMADTTYIRATVGKKLYVNNTSNNAISTNGGITAREFISTSDIRVKQELQPILNASEKLRTLRTTTHERTDYEKVNGQYPRKASVIAQDVEEVLPEAISYTDDTKLGRIRNVSIPATVVLTIAAVNEHTDTIARQAETIARLEERLTKLERLLGNE